MKKILLSSSVKHFNPITKEVRIRHSVGVLVELFSSVIEEMGEVTYIGDNDHLEGKEFDLIISWPRNFNYLTKNNKHKKSVCFFNIAESQYLKMALAPEAIRRGCKLSDCFTPRRYYHADLNFLIGGGEVKGQYVTAGVDANKIVNVAYRHGYIPFKKRAKNKKPIFIHIATTLGLRKGFWHVVNDFKNANIDAELWCVGKIQNEKYWIDFAKEANSHPDIKVIGWVDNSDPKYVGLIHSADFIVFPSFGEGQPGTVIEAMEGGCLPLLSEEAGIPYHPLGVYTRGNTEVWTRAIEMDNFEEGQMKMKKFIDEKYDNEKFKKTIKEEIEKLMGGD